MTWLHPVDLSLLLAIVVLALLFRRALVSDGFGLDRAFAAWFMRAKHGETMSYQFAVAAQDGKRWGCIGCYLLGKLVEQAHCRKTLMQDGPPTAALAGYRAGVLLFLLAGLVFIVPWAVGRFG